MVWYIWHCGVVRYTLSRRRSIEKFGHVNIASARFISQTYTGFACAYYFLMNADFMCKWMRVWPLAVYLAYIANTVHFFKAYAAVLLGS